jgi:hypothetical protein
MDFLTASIKEKLWHSMREDFLLYAPQLNDSNVLMCCACGRILPQQAFSLEHIIPQQALAHDPEEVKANPAMPLNARAGNTLLCSEPLKIKDRVVYRNGCNGWKGRHYDPQIRALLTGRPVGNPLKAPPSQMSVAALCLGFLAMFAEFGYQIALTPAGVLIRRQFFSPMRFRGDMPLTNQILLTGAPLTYEESHLEHWTKPFSFAIERSTCTVVIRNFVVPVPISRDPRVPPAKHIRIVPQRFKMRPNFETMFN